MATDADHRHAGNMIIAAYLWVVLLALTIAFL